MMKKTSPRRRRNKRGNKTKKRIIKRKFKIKRRMK